MTLILVEGLDRAGKTTRCRELMAEPRSRPRLMLHFVAPPKMTLGSVAVYREIAEVYRLAAERRDVDFVLDRGHVSWVAYEALLRGRRLEDTLGSQQWLEGLLRDADARVEYVEVKDDLVLARRDDGLSTYTPKNAPPLHRLRLTAEAVARERAVFEETLARCPWPVTRRVTG